MEGVIYEPADIVIYIQGKMVLKEKSLVAYETASGKIMAYGAGAERLIGQSAEITVASPLRRGMVTDFHAASALLAHLLHTAWGKKPLLKIPVVVCVPKGITEVEKKALEEALLYQAGVKEVTFADIPVEQFVKELPEKFPGIYHKCKTIIGITKDVPERYIAEGLQDILQYAKGEGMPAGRVAELLQELCGSEVTA